MAGKQLIAIFCANQLIHWFILGLIIPVMNLLQLEKGLDLFQIGVTYAVYSAAVFLLELPTGGLADAIGRKRVYLIAMSAQFLAALSILIAWNFPTMLVGFTFMGIARALSSGSLDAWFVDEFHKVEPGGNLQAALAKVGIFIPAGLGIGSLLGGYLPMSLGQLTASLPGLDKYSGNLGLILVIIILQFVLTSLLIYEDIQPHQHTGIVAGFRQFPHILRTSVQYGLKNRILFLLLLSNFAWGFAIAGLELLWQPRVKFILGSDSQTWIFGVLATGYFFASAVGNLLITRICALFQNNYRRVLVITRVVMAVLLFALTLQNQVPGFTLFYWAVFIFNGMSNSPHATLFNAEAPAEQRSTLLSFESFFLQIGGLPGALLMGYLSKVFAIPVAWVVGSEILVLSSLTYVFLPVNVDKQADTAQN